MLPLLVALRLLFVHLAACKEWRRKAERRHAIAACSETVPNVAELCRCLAPRNLALLLPCHCLA